MIGATVVGNVGRSELKETRAGSVLEFSVASSKRGKDGEKQTTWVRCTLWGKRAEALAQYVTKGGRVAVTGQLSLREYQAKDGGKGVSLDLDAADVELLGGGEERGEGDRPRRQRAAKKTPRDGEWPSDEDSFGPDEDIDFGSGDDGVPF